MSSNFNGFCLLILQTSFQIKILNYIIILSITLSISYSSQNEKNLFPFRNFIIN